MIVTDEMVKKAYDAAMGEKYLIHGTRAALEAVAPMLIAQGLREAAEIATQEFDPWRFILKRAYELDPSGADELEAKIAQELEGIKKPHGLTVDDHDGSELIVDNGGGFICDPRTI
ncbi:MAG: hypothetical protein EHM33_00480 [Chloroflexi bacterium]|nr:MAG: hypothetical protein EHM33_00480 [Chloroflexota bacterium]